MEIEYKQIKSFRPEQLKELFLSVGWSSGHFPERLAAALQNYGCVFSAWDGDRLAGLIGSMDDGNMNAYVHYLLVHPDYQNQGIGRELVCKTKAHYADYLRILLVAYSDEAPFYQRCGFEPHRDKVPMMITKLWT